MCNNFGKMRYRKMRVHFSLFCRCISVMDSDTSLCSTITQDYCPGDPFDISSSKYASLNCCSLQELNSNITRFLIKLTKHYRGGSRISHWGGTNPRWRGCQPPTQVLFGENICKNERIWSCWGGARRKLLHVDPPLHYTFFRFERTGTTVAVTFNAPTEIGSTSTGRFDCSLLLSFDATQSLGNGQECQVKSNEAIMKVFVACCHFGGY